MVKDTDDQNAGLLPYIGDDMRSGKIQAGRRTEFRAFSSHKRLVSRQFERPNQLGMISLDANDTEFLHPANVQ